MTMSKQYCKVGTITPLEGAQNTLQILKWQYANFVNKANADSQDHNLAEFFQSKAKKIKKSLEDLAS